MKQYHDLVAHVFKHGHKKEDRTKTGTISTFGYQMRFDLSEGFPLLTTKKVFYKAIIYELIWFIKGDTNIKYLVDHGVKIWNEWPYENFKRHEDYQGESLETFVEKIKHDDVFAKKHGDLGPVYGAQWRNFNGVDQLAEVIHLIKHQPNSRRMILSAWNPAEIHNMALPPCHTLIQFYVANNKLSLQLYQRSGDIFLGIPFNIGSYALLLEMIAQVTNLEVGEFVHTIGDAHIYANHVEQLQLQLTRDIRPLPKLKLNKDITELEDFEFEDIEI
ncbi:MAG: thymidylate synthase, partial [Acholeplasmataceae bacterium]